MESYQISHSLRWKIIEKKNVAVHVPKFRKGSESNNVPRNCAAADAQKEKWNKMRSGAAEEGYGGMLEWCEERKAKLVKYLHLKTGYVTDFTNHGYWGNENYC